MVGQRTHSQEEKTLDETLHIISQIVSCVAASKLRDLVPECETGFSFVNQVNTSRLRSRNPLAGLYFFQRGSNPWLRTDWLVFNCCWHENLLYLQSSIFSIEYSLLQPRSALRGASVNLTIKPSLQPLTHFLHIERSFTSFRTMRNCRYKAWAASIFEADWFGQWVVTHSLADSNFHGHCPGVFIQQHFLWYLIMSVQSGTFKTLLSIHLASPILLTKRGPQIEYRILLFNIFKIIE